MNGEKGLLSWRKHLLTIFFSLCSKKVDIEKLMLMTKKQEIKTQNNWVYETNFIIYHYINNCIPSKNLIKIYKNNLIIVKNIKETFF